MEKDKKAESVGDDVKDRTSARDGRSFKAVVEGLPQHLKIEKWVTKNTRPEGETSTDEDRNLLGKEKFKEMAWSLVEELFNSISLEETKRNLRALMEVVVQAVVGEPHGCRRENLKPRKDGKDDQRGVFLEEGLI